MRSYVSAILFLVISGAIGFAYWMTWPTIARFPLEVDADSLSFGTAARQAEISHSITVTNTSHERVARAKLISSCNCTKVTPSEFSLDPGDSVILKLSIDPSPVNHTDAAASSYPFTVLLTATIADLQQTWTVAGTVLNAFRQMPSAIDFGDVWLKEQNSRNFLVETHEPLSVLYGFCPSARADILTQALDSSAKRFNVTIVLTDRLDGDVSFPVRLRAKPKKRPGLDRVPENFEAAINIHARAVEAFECLPSSIHVQRVADKASVEESLVIRPRSAAVPDIKDVVVNLSGFSTESATHSPITVSVAKSETRECVVRIVIDTSIQNRVRGFINASITFGDQPSDTTDLQIPFTFADMTNMAFVAPRSHE